MRFTNANGLLVGFGADRFIYYSDIEPDGFPDGDKADTGIPSNVNPGAFVDEVGVEGNNGFQYLTFSATSNEFDGISDVPEPGN